MHCYFSPTCPMQTKRYAINDSKVISETLEGETIIINLENGNYYSLNTTASVVWEMIVGKRTVDDMVGRIMGEYEVARQAAAEAVATFVEYLTQDNLIVETTEEEVSEIEVAPATPVTKQAFVAPFATRYEDMQQMLLADPIHDVDVQGWPILKKN